MNTKSFKKLWDDIKYPLVPLSSTRLSHFNLQKETFDFLSLTGLPTYAEPNLHFANDSDDLVYG